MLYCSDSRDFKGRQMSCLTPWTKPGIVFVCVFECGTIDLVYTDLTNRFPLSLAHTQPATTQGGAMVDPSSNYVVRPMFVRYVRVTPHVHTRPHIPEYSRHISVLQLSRFSHSHYRNLLTLKMNKPGSHWRGWWVNRIVRRGYHGSDPPPVQHSNSVYVCVP